MNIRKKGKWKTGEIKYVIEDKGRYVETLPEINALLKLLRLEITSCPTKEEKIEKPENVSKTSLNVDYTNHQNKTDKDKIQEELNKLGVI